MFNSVLLDVFIGLVLLYLLYSLLVSIISEMIAGWLGLRSRMLRKAIETMLNDSYRLTKYQLRIFRRLGSFFLYENEQFLNSFAGKFYKHPSIRYLSGGQKQHRFSFQQGKPSYISEETFTDTIIQLLRNKGNGTDDMERISFTLKFNTIHIQPQTLAHFRNLLADSHNELNAFKDKLVQWYKETMDRTNGWYKRKLQFILFWLGFIIAMTFNVDSIKITKQLATDKNARNQMVELGILASDESSPIGKAVKRNGDSITSDSLMRKSYTEVRKATDDANKVLGLGWQLESRVKTNRINRKIYPSTLLALQKQIINPAAVLKQSIQFYRKLMDKTKNKNKRNSYAAGIKAKTDSLAFLIKRFNYITSSGFTLDDSIHVHVLQIGENPQKACFTGKRHFSFRDDVGYIIRQSLPWRLSFWGFVITALMISLGAPFWFDLLKKLVAIRSAGVKPEERKETVQDTTRIIPSPTPPVVTAGPAAPPVMPIVHDTFITEAINQYGPEIKKIPGVKSVFKGRVKMGDPWVDCVQVNVNDPDAERAVRAKFPSLMIENIAVEMNIVISGNPQTHQSNEGQISNQSGLNGYGSLGCVLKNTVSGNLHLLSCWHVMKGNLDYDTDDDQVFILDNSVNDQVIGKRWGGGIQGTLDYAIARCLQPANLEKNKWLKEKLDFSSGKVEFKPISSKEINSQINVCFYDIFSGKRVDGKIYTDTDSVEIQYADGNFREVQDLLLLTDDSLTRSISQGGNSGSIVFTEAGKAIGMIIAGDKLYTYAIKLSNLFSLFDEMILDS